MGQYSVKSGYRVGCSLGDDASPSNMKPTKSWWKFLWCLKIPSKIKIFIWKACHHWLPTLLSLTKRGIKVVSSYNECHSRPESIYHAFWGCSYLKPIRRSLLFLEGLTNIESLHFLDFMLICKSRLKQVEMKSFCVILWRVWCNRNRKLHSLPQLPVDQIVDWSFDFLREFQEANSYTVPNTPQVIPRRSAPGRNLIKVNT
ncbi:hypothetical protein ACOSQ3_022726 [Xanthoceras sorbifolium]